MRVEELSLSLTCCSTQENRPYTSPRQHRRAGPGCEGCKWASSKGVSTGKVGLLLVSWTVAAGMRERCLPPLPYHLWQIESWPQGHENGKLVLIPHTWENRPRTLPGQQGRAGPGFGGFGGWVLVSWPRRHKSRRSSKLRSSDTFNWPTSASTPSMNCWSAGPKDPKLEDLHSTGQERIYKRSSFVIPVLVE